MPVQCDAATQQLLDAVSRGKSDDVRILLGYPYQVSADAASANGRTGLMTAAQTNHCECATILLNGGASVNFADACGNTALHTAALHGHCSMISLLIRHGADIDAVTSKAKTAFALSIASGAAEAARTLACAGCMVHAGSTQMQMYRESAKYMDRRVRWPKTKQVLALLDLLERTPRNDWSSAFQSEWPEILQGIQERQRLQEAEDQILEQGWQTMMKAREAAAKLKGAKEARQRREEREAEARQREAQRELEEAERRQKERQAAEQLAAQKAARLAKQELEIAQRKQALEKQKAAERSRIDQLEKETAAIRAQTEKLLAEPETAEEELGAQNVDSVAENDSAPISSSGHRQESPLLSPLHSSLTSDEVIASTQQTSVLSPRNRGEPVGRSLSGRARAEYDAIRADTLDTVGAAPRRTTSPPYLSLYGSTRAVLSPTSRRWHSAIPVRGYASPSLARLRTDSYRTNRSPASSPIRSKSGTPSRLGTRQHRSPLSNGFSGSLKAADSLFERLDTDGDGNISRKEFQNGALRGEFGGSIALPQPRDAQLQADLIVGRALLERHR